MGALLKEKYSTKVDLIPSEGGVFEVVVDGNLVYSKKKLNRFPEEGEVEGLVG